MKCTAQTVRVAVDADACHLWWASKQQQRKLSVDCSNFHSSPPSPTRLLLSFTHIHTHTICMHFYLRKTLSRCAPEVQLECTRSLALDSSNSRRRLALSPVALTAYIQHTQEENWITKPSAVTAARALFAAECGPHRHLAVSGTDSFRKTGRIQIGRETGSEFANTNQQWEVWEVLPTYFQLQNKIKIHGNHS